MRALWVLGGQNTLGAAQGGSGMDGGAGSTLCAHCPARVNTPGTAARALLGSSRVPANPGLHPSKPNVLLQQFGHHGPANPVLCLSNPGTASQQVQFCVPANHWVCCIPEIPVLCSTEPNRVFQQGQCHLPAIQVSASTAVPTKAGQDTPVGEWGLWLRSWLGLG